VLDGELPRLSGPTTLRAGQLGVRFEYDFGDAMLGSPLYEACVPAVFLFDGQGEPLEAMLDAAGLDLSDGAWRQELTRCVVTHRYCDPSWLLEQLGLKKQARPQVRALIDALCGARQL